MLVDVLLREVVPKIDSFVVKQLNRLILLVLFSAPLASLSCPIIIVIVVVAETKQSVCIDFSLIARVSRVNYVQVRLQLVFSSKRDIALLLALFIRAKEVRPRKMHLQGLIVVVVHVAVLLAAQVTRQVHSVEVLLEAVDVEEVLLAEIAPRVRQYLGAPVAGRITMLDMVP